MTDDINQLCIFYLSINVQLIYIEMSFLKINIQNMILHQL